MYRKEAGKKAGCSDGKGRRYEKGGIVAIVEGEAHGGLGLRGGLLGVQTQSHIGRIIILKLTYKLGGLLLLSPIGFRMEPQLGLYAILGEMLGLGYPTDDIPSSMEDIVAALIPISNKSSVKSAIARLVVAASSYYIWQERNNRIFKKKSRKVEQLRDAIITIIRLKLMSLRYKNSENVARCLDHWQISKYNMSYDL
ncbi:hypothetical protein Tco_0693723 [Tanacetum coccineum]